MKIPSTGGRYPGASFLPVTYFKEAIHCQLSVVDGLLVVNLFDANHPDRWETFAVNADEVVAWLAEQGPGD